MGQSVWARPRITPPPAPPRPPPVVYTSMPPVAAQPPRATAIPYYSQSRIFKDIKVVKDLRQSGTERGETQTGDSGYLGPGSLRDESLSPLQTALPGKSAKNNLVPIALAVAAFFLLGG